MQGKRYQLKEGTQLKIQLVFSVFGYVEYDFEINSFRFKNYL